MTIQVREGVEIRPLSFHSRYLATSDGQIFDQKRDIFLKLTPNQHFGYPMVNLQADDKSRTIRRVHELIASVFLPSKPNSDYEIAHEDGNPMNNSAGNLYWKTHTENEADKRRHGTLRFGEDNPAAVLTESKVLRIRELLEEGELQKDIAAMMGIHQVTVSQIKLRKIWGHLA